MKRINTLNTFEDDFLKMLYNTDTPLPIKDSHLVISLHESDPQSPFNDRHRGKEVKYKGYKRQYIKRNSENWNVESILIGYNEDTHKEIFETKVTNRNLISFPSCTGGESKIEWVCILKEDGTPLFDIQLSDIIHISAGYTPEFYVGKLASIYIKGQEPIFEF